MGVEPLVVLEIGTAKVCALVGLPREDGNIAVVGVGKSPSCGVRKGDIIDLESASACVKAALQNAEESAHLTIGHVYLTLSGGHIRCERSQGTVPVMDVEGGVNEDDIQDVMDAARAIRLPVDRQIFHTITQKFSVDGQGGILNPEGMRGASLSLRMLVLHGKRTLLDNAVAVVKHTGVDIMDVVFSGLCSAMAVLTAEQKTGGVLLIDIGAGTTEYIAYADNAIADAGVFAVAGDHITNDISVAFNISPKRAERIKCESGSAVPDSTMRFKQLAVAPEMGFQGCSIRMSDLSTVISVRIEELFNMIKDELSGMGLLNSIGAGVVLTGGSAHMKDVCLLAERVFGLPCVIGKPRGISGVATAYECPEYAAPVGMLRHAAKLAQQVGNDKWDIFGLLGRIIRR